MYSEALGNQTTLISPGRKMTSHIRDIFFSLVIAVKYNVYLTALLVAKLAPECMYPQ